MKTMAELPTGTLTFLLTDIEGSTKLWEQDPEVMRLALARHDTLLTDCIQEHGGTVVKSRGEGDSHFAVFPYATDALRAACAIQQVLLTESWPPEAALRVRVALHTGEADLRDGDYYGRTVNHCARIRASAHGGQVLMSRVTFELAKNCLPHGISMKDLGPHVLKDLEQPVHLYQLLHSALPVEFPPVRSPILTSNNLSPTLTRFIGREQEKVEVRHLLTTSRLLTLTGAGGCGKTRLALQVAAGLTDEYSDGVWLVELASLFDPKQITKIIASVLGLQEERTCSLEDALIDHLRSKALLLVLDNCEHLIGACMQVVDRLLRRCPKVQVLATSREAMGLMGEQIYRVPPLSYPKTRHLPRIDRLQEFEAVQLFADRAALIDPTFAITEVNAPAVAQVCQRLDGIPLAIELAAARLRALSVEQLAARLDDCFRLLTEGNRGALPRHKTLRAVIDWSYGLLSEPEQLLFRRLSVFTGIFSLEAVEVVCSGEGVAVEEVIDLLGQLLAKSLVTKLEDGGEARYQLLETIRSYGRNHLRETGEMGELRLKHHDWYLCLAEQAHRDLNSPSQLAWLHRLEQEHDNIRAALDWSEENGEIAGGLRLAAALQRFWEIRGHLTEGRERLSRLLGMTGAMCSAATRAKALNAAGVLADCQGDYEVARSLFEECLTIQRELDDIRGIAYSLNNLAILSVNQSDYTIAEELHQESLALKRCLDDTWGVASTMQNLGVIARLRGDYETARSRYAESYRAYSEVGDKLGTAHSLANLGNVAVDEGDLENANYLHRWSLGIQREMGDKLGIATALTNMGNVAYLIGDLKTSYSYYSESLELSRGLGDKHGIAASLANLGSVACTMSALKPAITTWRQSLTLFCELKDKYGIIRCLRGIAWAVGEQGQWERGVRLLGAAQAFADALGVTITPRVRGIDDHCLAAAECTLSKVALEAAWAEGTAMTFDQAIACALLETPQEK